MESIKITIIVLSFLFIGCGNYQHGAMDLVDPFSDGSYYNEIDMRVWADMADENEEIVSCPEDPLNPECPGICYKLYVERMEVGSQLRGFREEEIGFMYLVATVISDGEGYEDFQQPTNFPGKLDSYATEESDIAYEKECDETPCQDFEELPTDKKYPETMIKLSENQWRYHDGEGSEQFLDLKNSTELFTGYYYGSERGNINQQCDGFMSKAVKFNKYIFFFQARNCLKFCKVYYGECS